MRGIPFGGIGVLLCLVTAAASAQAPSSTSLAPGQFVAGAEALAWWMKSSPAPVPLITDGVVGDPNTHVLLGGQSVDIGTSPGFRLTAGYGLTNRSALEANFFYLPSRSKSTSVASNGNQGSTDLLLPYIDALTNRETVTEISLAPVYRGGGTEEYSIKLLGAELNGAWAMAPAGGWQMDFIGGFRYLRLNEKYSLSTESPYNPPYPQDTWLTNDSFETTNNFYGAQAGIRARIDQGSFIAGGSVKVALGAMVQTVDISGSLVTNDFTNFGPTQAYPGGYFALPSNIGNYSRTQFAVVPEVALNVGYRITPSATISLGYSFLYASNVARPGNQINRTLNTTQSIAFTEDPAARLRLAAQPSFQFNDSNFWAQGVSLGLEVRF